MRAFAPDIIFVVVKQSAFANWPPSRWIDFAVAFALGSWCL